jgi:hypothetical protein
MEGQEIFLPESWIPSSWIQVYFSCNRGIYICTKDDGVLWVWEADIHRINGPEYLAGHVVKGDLGFLSPLKHAMVSCLSRVLEDTFEHCLMYRSWLGGEFIQLVLMAFPISRLHIILVNMISPIPVQHTKPAAFSIALASTGSSGPSEISSSLVDLGCSGSIILISDFSFSSHP